MRNLFFVFLSIVMLSLFGCHSVRIMSEKSDQIQTKATNDVIEVRADSLDIDFQTTVPPRYFNKRALMKIEPIMINGNDTTKFEPVYVAGEKVVSKDKTIFQRVPFKTGATIPYHKRIAYLKKMGNSKISVFYSFRKDSKYNELAQCPAIGKSKKIDEGIITTSLTVKNSDNLQAAGNFDPVPIQQKGTIYYEINKSNIKKTEADDPEISKLKSLLTDPKYVITSISFHSAASPDGPLAFNTTLSEDRTINSSDFVLDEFKKIGFQTVYDSSFIKKSHTSEDWDGFKELVENSNLSTKNDIIAICNSNLPLDVKEKNIKKLGNWDVLAKDYLPKLRKSDVILFGETKMRKYDELKVLFDNNKLDEFNKPEILLFASNNTDLDQKLTVYKYYRDKYPNEWIGDNNIAYVYLMKGDPDKAIEIMKKLNDQYPDNKEILNNIGVCYRMKKDYNKALEYFIKANGKGVDERNNTAITDMQLAKYDEALKSFEPDRCDYNKALAYTLSKDYSNGLKTIDCIEDKSADDFYLRAIIAARMDDLDLLCTSLTRAIAKDPGIRKRATEDYEFRNYWRKVEFVNAIR